MFRAHLDPHSSLGPRTSCRSWRQCLGSSLAAGGAPLSPWYTRPSACGNNDPPESFITFPPPVFCPSGDGKRAPFGTGVTSALCGPFLAHSPGPLAPRSFPLFSSPLTSARTHSTCRGIPTPPLPSASFTKKRINRERLSANWSAPVKPSLSHSAADG